ncbi:copper-binding protein [Microbacteriaceae bacterium K1510]|nr:copper-binding protein [Microbacteriaceae bacterium K1510]
MNAVMLLSAACARMQEMERKLTIAKAAAIFSTTVSAQTIPTDGQVTKIDQGQNKMALKHGPIKNLDMDCMTIVFVVADPAMLKALKVGDQVKFEANRVNGRLTVTKIEKAK